ncbi:MAG: kynureninase [Syntrophorhabdus aromaticivorans]|uniref:Kynureninase n=1 Tax=Syntrophorhabdus aromaticivorans TaxID=328301 RepID=A0A971S1D0_9BACT|nr:kynureninase [Syntrophorhabdus aromaticivorans]
MGKTLGSEKLFAAEMDAKNDLASFRDRFSLIPGAIYMDGNSLGLCPKEAGEAVERTIEEWKTLGIRGWMEGNPPWFEMAERTGSDAASLVGAEGEEVVLSGTTTVNLHALVSTFYEPTPERNVILADELNFPSDIYALRSQVAIRGYDPEKSLRLVRSLDSRFLDEDQIISEMTPDVALVVLPSVLYRSGQLLDMERLAAAARERGILTGFDCAHSVGAIPHSLSEWGVDFAFWCSYKYMNSGPGSPAFLYVNRRHFGKMPALAGWFGYDKARQFDMNIEFMPAGTAGAWQISSPSILGSAAAGGALKVTLEAGIGRIRSKSLELTSFFMRLVDEYLSGEPYNFSTGTPREPERRGGHVALEHPTEALRINEALIARGVIPDFRPPQVIRIAPIALYNTFTEVWQVAMHLKEIIDNREYEKFSRIRKAVS